MQGGNGRAEAIAAFERWMRQCPAAPRRGIDLVRDVTSKHKDVGRMTSNIEGRKFVWCSKPALARQPLSPLPLDPSRLDPWNPPTDLDRSTRYICTCEACRGEGKLMCGLCRGTARVGCDDCGGRGKRWGTAKNGAHRLLNCQSCRGKGDLKCDYCTRGHVDCNTCSASKKLERWLAVDTWSRSTVLSHPHVDFGNEPIERDAVVVASVRGIQVGPSDLVEAAAWVSEGWNHVQPKLETGERVYAQTFELLDVPSMDVTYSVWGRQQVVTFEGLRLKPPSVTVDTVFGRRSNTLSSIALGSLALLIAFVVWWMTRGSYYKSDRTFGCLGASLFSLSLISFLGYRVLWNYTLGRSRRAKFWAIPVVLPLITVAGSLALSAPSMDRARSYLAFHDLKDADVELAALGSDNAANELRGDVALAHVMSAKTCAEAVVIAGSISPTLAQRARSIEHANDLAFAAATLTKNPNELDCATASFRDSAKAKGLRASIALAKVDECSSSHDWNCALAQAQLAISLGAKDETKLVYTQVQAELDKVVVSLRTERETPKRLELEKAGLELSTHLQQPAAATLAMLTSSQKRDDAQLLREQDNARKVADAEAKRQEQIEAREQARQAAEERRREAAAAATLRGDGGLMCNDGTESPSCSCGGSHRGCCSHHGGVAGCS